MTANSENSAVATGLEKVSFHSNPKERQYQRMLKLLHNCTHLTCQLSNAQKFSKPGFNSTLNKNFQMFKPARKRQRNQRPNCQHPLNYWKKQESSRKTSTSDLLIKPKTLTVWITTKCGRFSKRWKYQTTWPASWEICMQVKRQQSELDMEE